ncbi:MAG: hypothetical protein D6738_03815 [Acidobacteria bacterium]|nr:MAG: hypothetical protein D6738_03815 [Acidobacteriota bacterium]
MTIGGLSFVSAAAAPDAINYQGVLRDAADAPLDGGYDMVFRFWSAETAGDEILIDRHLAVNSQAVTVSGGTFSVRLGTGEVLDGSGPGAYGSLTKVFANYSEVWLEVQVGSETLSPRMPVSAAGFALNASRVGGLPRSSILDTSADPQTKSAKLVLDQADTGAAVDYGIEATGQDGGGYFQDSDNSGYAYVGSGDYGIRGYGNTAGGYFEDRDGSGDNPQIELSHPARPDVHHIEQGDRGHVENPDGGRDRGRAGR